MKPPRLCVILTLLLLVATTVSATTPGHRLLLSEKTTTAPVRRRLLSEETIKWWKDRYDASKSHNVNYQNGSCWRKAAFADKDGECELGYRKRIWGLCTSYCPVKTPVNCGPVCLPQGRSCVYEMAKKVSVVGLFITKVFTVGFLAGIDAQVNACLAFLKGADDPPDRLRRLQECNTHIHEVETLDEVAFAKLVKAVIPEPPEVKRHRQLTLDKKTMSCGSSLYFALKGLATAWKKHYEKGLKTKEGFYAEAGTTVPIANAVSACLKQLPDNGMRYGGAMEVLVKTLTDQLVGPKPLEDNAVDAMIGVLVKFDPFGIISLVHEFSHAPCKPATGEGKKHDKQITDVAEMKKELGLNGTGVFSGVEGSWTPNDASGAKGTVYLSINSNLKDKVELVVYSGGRTLKDTGPGTTKVIAVSSDKADVVKVPLADVHDRTLYVEAVIGLDTKEWVSNKMKGFFNTFYSYMTLGLVPEKVVTKNVKLGSLVVWVPGESSGVNLATGMLLVKATLNERAPPTVAPAPAKAL